MIPTESTDNITLFTRHQTLLQRYIDQRQQLSNRYSWLRVMLFFGGLLFSALAFYTTALWISALILLLAIFLFATVVYVHQRVNHSLHRFQLMQQIKRTHVARIQRDWQALPSALQIELDYEHPFAADLDILGPRSLHRLLDTTATKPGRMRLFAWLTTVDVPSLETIATRQACVRELIPRTLFRDRLTLQGQRLNRENLRRDEKPNEHHQWQPDQLLAWLQEHRTPMNLQPWVWAMSLLALINWGLFTADFFGWLGPLWRLSLALYAIFLFWHGETIAATFREAGAVRGELEQLMRIFRRLERYDYRNTPHLQQLCAPFQTATIRPSHHLRRVARIAAATGVQGNPVIALILNVIAPWGLYFAWQLSKEKEELSDLLPTWLDCWAELEALCALATFGMLNPQSTFPTLQRAAVASQAGESGTIPFSVKQLGHPLLSPAEKVRNDFHFDALGNVVILTGSNMSGKSTFLKALALNLSLAYAGSPVDAAQLAVPRLRLFTCIKVSDSVTDGISYFYAEVRRLKALLDALETEDESPLFYIVDEIFRGTNNRERLDGSRAYIRALATQAGLGFVATHDLELVRLGDEISTITNYHFRDDIVDGRMVFDYQLRAGPSPTTNALKIMRHAGLPVD